MYKIDKNFSGTYLTSPRFIATWEEMKGSIPKTLQLSFKCDLYDGKRMRKSGERFEGGNC